MYNHATTNLVMYSIIIYKDTKDTYISYHDHNIDNLVLLPRLATIYIKSLLYAKNKVEIFSKKAIGENSFIENTNKIGTLVFC